jgi:hypothetical protein
VWEMAATCAECTVKIAAYKLHNLSHLLKIVTAKLIVFSKLQFLFVFSNLVALRYD